MTQNKLEEYKELLRKLLTPKKFSHSISVMNTAKTIAILYGCDEQKASLAGLLHDITKNLSHAKQLQLCEDFGIIPDKVSATEHKLIHAVTGEGFLRYKLDINDNDILNAVRYHTTGRADMSALEKTVFLADYTEPLRIFCGVSAVRELILKGLPDEALFLALNQTISALADTARLIHPDTLAARNSLIENGLIKLG